MTMEIEKFVSGYCRQLDGARTVEVIVTDGNVDEVDCAFGSCPYENNCPIGREIRLLTNF